jgi:pimeloyl-ACP methyl ester carboxylesterase
MYLPTPFSKHTRAWEGGACPRRRLAGSQQLIVTVPHPPACNTPAGIDVCGQRLAQEVQQLVSATPGLTTISFLGHSMGGLIARCAIGLLTDPSSSTVAGLEPCCYISIATPHLGCSSSHPEEVRPGPNLAQDLARTWPSPSPANDWASLALLDPGAAVIG